MSEIDLQDTRPQQSKGRRSLYNIISAALGQVLIFAIGFLMPWLQINILGSEINGLLGSVNQVLLYLSLFEAGVGAVAMQALYRPVSRGDWNSINGILSATNLYYKKASLYYALGLVGLALAYPLFVTVSLSYLQVFLLILVCGAGSALSFYFQAKLILFLKVEGKNYITNNIATLVAVLSGLIKAALILLGYNVLVVMSGAFLVQGIPVIFYARYIKKKYPQLSYLEKPDFAAIAQRNYMLVHQASQMVFQNTDVILLSIVSGLKVASVYAVYKMVLFQLHHIATIIQNSVDFILGQTYSQDLQRYVVQVDLFESYFSAFTFAMHAVVFYVLYAFMRLYTAGAQDVVYTDKLLVFYFVAIEIFACMRIPMERTIHYAGHFKLTTSRSLLETAINLLLSIALVGSQGMYGVLFGTLLALIYRANDIILYANHRLLKRKPWRTYRIYLVNFLGFGLVQILFSVLFPSISGWFSLVLTTLLCGLLALAIFFGLQTLAFRDNRNHLKSLLNRHLRP